MTPNLILQGNRVRLRTFVTADISEKYLDWLNDPEVNRFSRRSTTAQPITRTDAELFLSSLRDNEVVLAIEAAPNGHVGNAKFGPIDLANGRADISILLGDRAVWGCGIGSETIYLIAKHLFADCRINRIDAGSANPAFIAMVTRLGWQIEGRLRSYVRLADGLHDWTILSQLRPEFRVIDRFESQLACS